MVSARRPRARLQSIHEGHRLGSAQPRHRRGDFLPAEMRDGEDRFFSQRDNRSSNDVVYRLRVREAGSERLIIELENVTAVRFPWFFCSPPGDLRSVHFLERKRGGRLGLLQRDADRSRRFPPRHRTARNPTSTAPLPRSRQVAGILRRSACQGAAGAPSWSPSPSAVRPALLRSTCERRIQPPGPLGVRSVAQSASAQSVTYARRRSWLSVR
jgi:hypothetical protein